MKSKNFLSNLWSSVVGSRKDDGSTRLRVDYDSIYSRSACAPRTPSLFEAKSRLASPHLRVWPLKIVAVLAILLTIGSGNVWGADITLEITVSSFGSGTTSSYADMDWSEDASDGTTISGTGKIIMDASAIRFKSSYIYNTVAMPGAIKSIEVTKASGTSRSITPYIYTSSMASGTSGATALSAETHPHTWTMTAAQISANNRYFRLNMTTNSAYYVGKIIITCDAGGGSTPSVTPDPTSLDWGTVLQGSSQGTKTISISGSNLTAGDLTISATGGYSVTPTSKSVSGTLSATTLTVTPPSTSTTGTKNGKVTISGGGLASNVEVNLSMTVNAAYAVHYYVNGSEITELKELVASGGKVSSLPTDDDIDNCDADGHPYFVGWSTSNFGTRNTAPTTLVDGTEIINEEKHYYAVFAAGTGGSSSTSTIDFESAAGDYSAWSFSNITSKQTGTITANGGTYYGITGAATASVTTISKIASPTSLTAYVSKQTTNTTSSTWYIRVSSNGSTWTNVTSQSATSMSKGDWVEMTADLTDYSDVYVQVYYNGSTAVRNIDDLTLSSGTPPTYTEWITKCCESWTPPTLSYSVPSGWKNGNSDVNATLGSGTTYGSTTWTSSDESVLTVNSSGQIHAVGAGTATVTVTWEGDATHCSQSRTSAAITVTGSVAVSFNANGGSLGTTSQSITYNTSTALTTFANLSGSAPSCKQFDHWNTAADNSGTTYTDGQSVTLLAGLTLYAIYRDITYAVSDGSMTGVASHSYSSNPIACGTTLTITCAADGDHKGNPTVTATGTHGAITVVSATSVTIANVTSAITVSISYAEKTNVTATWHAASGSVTGGTTTTQKEGTTFTFPNVTSVDCGTFLGWTNAANSGYNSTSGKPATFYNVGATTTLDANTDFYAVYSKVSDDAVAGVLYHHEDTGTDLTDDDHDGVTVTGTGLGAYASAPYIKFDGIGDKIIFELDGTPTSFSASFTTASSGTAGFSGFTLYESDSKTGEWTKIGEEVGASSKSASFTLSISNAALFNQRVLKLEMTSKSLNVGCGEITINGLRAPINYTTNPGCVDWVLDAINVTTAPTKTTYGECEEFDPAGMVVTATMKENGNPSNTTTKDVAGYTWTPTQFMTPGNSVAVTISYTEKAVTKTTTTNVRVNDLANYTITFHDGGNTTTWTQSNHCDACNLDSRTGSLACGDYTFAGWSTSSTSYDDQSATITTWVSGSYVPTANTNLYAVYRKGAAPAEFTANCAGGTFTIGTKKGGSTIISRAANTGSFNSYEYGVENSSYTEDQLGKFLFEKVADNTYKISLEREDDYGGGIKRFYVAPDDYSAGSFEFLETYDADQCKWKVVAGTYGTWRIYTEFRNTYVTKDYGIGGKGNEALPRFRLVPTSNINGSDNYDVELTPVATPIYQSNPSCSGTYTITFNTHGGTFVQGDYEYSTETTDGLSGTTNSYFPSATMPGCTFVGWKEGSAQEEENSDAPVGLFEEGDALVVSSNKTYHAVYYYFDDDWEFDPEVGGTYHLYYEVSETKYFVSSTPTDSWAYLSTSSDCTDAKDVVITPGTGVNEGKYSISVDGYTIIPENGGTKFKRGEFWWTFTDRGDGTYAINGMNNNRNIVGNSAGTSMQHVGYNSGSSYSGWYYPSIGRCRQHHWTSDPVLMPLITLGSTGSLNVTSTNGKTVYAANKLTIEATRYGEQTKLYLFSNNANIGFRKGDGTALDADAVGPYIQTDASGELATTNITITYTPSVSTDGIETATITVRDNTSPSVQASATRVVKARHLPTDFVIAAKIGDNWYALPADCSTSSSSTAGVLIEVDNTSDPTRATGAPMNTKYGLQPVRPGRVSSYGNRLVFTEHLSTLPENQKTLYNGATTSIQVNATYANYATTNPEKYEWIPTTSDLKDYTLTSATVLDGDASARTVSLNTSGVFGTLLQAKAYDGKVRLLPATFYEPAEVQILKWKANSVIVMYTGTENATTKVGTNPVSGSQALDSHKLTHGIYEFTTNVALTENAGQTLCITLGSSRLEVEIPLIIATNTTAAADGKDVVILDGAKFTATGAKHSYRNVYVYGGGKLDIPTSTSLGVNNIILRAGGITTSGIGSSPAATYEYKYPQVKLVGTLTSTQTNIKYEYVTDYNHWYHLCLPFNAALSSIQYPQEYYGDIVTASNTGSWIIKRYDGETRARGNYDAWKDIEKDTPAKTEVTAGHGYIFWGAPKKVTISGETQRQAWGIQRMTMAIAAGDAKTAENANKTVSDLEAYSGETGGVNDQGWNLIGNPYMVNLTGLSSESIKTGNLVKEMVGGQWTGKWITGDSNDTRYITVPDNNFETYEAQPTSYFDGSTLEKSLIAGRTFFVQLADEATSVIFDKDNRAALAPAWHRNAEAEQTVDVETGIVMSSETLADEVNFWIKDGKTEAYEFNADYPKTLNKTNFNIYGVHQSGNLSWVAISPAIAEGDMAIGYQVPAAGDYTLSLSEKYIAEEIESVLVTDHGASPELTTDLMVNTYTFTVHQAETNNERFTVSIKVREEDNTPTDIGNSTVETHAVKFIRDDKMYILRNGLLYDATGKRVNVINK